MTMTHEEILEFLYSQAPEERLILAIHGMAIRYGRSLEAGRRRRSRWQLNAIVRLSGALYKLGR